MSDLAKIYDWLMSRPESDSSQVTVVKFEDTDLSDLVSTVGTYLENSTKKFLNVFYATAVSVPLTHAIIIFESSVE